MFQCCHRSSSEREPTAAFKMSKDDNPSCTVVIETKDDPEAEEQPDVDITIPGVKRVLDGKYGFWGKAIWILALLASTVACVVLTVDIFVLYLERAVSVDSKVLRNSSVYFPAVTLCPGLLSVNYHQIFDLIEECSEDEECPDGFIREALDTVPWDMEQIWESTNIPEEAITVLTPCGNIRDEMGLECRGYTTFPMTYSYLKTFWGTCLIMKPVESKMKFQGPDTYIRILINDSMIEKTNDSDGDRDSRLRSSELLYYLHHPDKADVHDAVLNADKLVRNYLTEVRFDARQYKFLNRTENPCDNEEIAISCRARCIEKCFRELVTCRLPFMESSDLPACKNMTEGMDAYIEAEYFYDHGHMCRDMCSCRRSCNSIVYTTNTDVMYKLHPTDTVFHLYFPDNLFRVMSERYVYGTSELLSDLVANLSFYLGICALTSVQALEICYQYWRLKTKGK